MIAHYLRCKWNSADYVLKSVCLRYFNAAGVHPDGLLGERHDSETHLVPLALQVASGRRAAIRILAMVTPRRSAPAFSDYIHVTDFCQAHLLDGGDCDAYNLCNGASFSVLEVIESARKVTGQKIFIDHVPRRLRPSTPELATPLRRSGCHRGACLAMRAQP